MIDRLIFSCAVLQVPGLRVYIAFDENWADCIRDMVGNFSFSTGEVVDAFQSTDQIYEPF